MVDRIYAFEIYALREKGLTFSQIATLYGINQGVAYRLYMKYFENPTYSERVGNKKPREEREFIPLWEYDAEWVDTLYEYLPRILAKYVSPSSIKYWEWLDFLLDMAYTTPNILEADNPIPYFWGMVRKRIFGYFLHEGRKDIEKTFSDLEESEKAKLGLSDSSTDEEESE